jgi:hypothetical protein
MSFLFRNLCRYLLFAYQAINTLDKYSNLDADPKPAENVNVGQESSNIVDAESKFFLIFLRPVPLFFIKKFPHCLYFLGKHTNSAYYEHNSIAMFP